MRCVLRAATGRDSGQRPTWCVIGWHHLAEDARHRYPARLGCAAWWSSAQRGARGRSRRGRHTRRTTHRSGSWPGRASHADAWHLASLRAPTRNRSRNAVAVAGGDSGQAGTAGADRLISAHDRRTRLLRGAGRRAHRRRRRHQARLPQARPAVAPGRQHGPEGAGAVQGGQRGLPGPLRSPAPPGLRHVRPGGGQRRRAGGRRIRSAAAPGFGGFGDIFDAFFGGLGGAARPGVRDPARAPTCATTSGSRSRRRSWAPRRRSSSRSSAAATPAAGSGREGGLHAGPVPPVQRARRGPVRAPDDARPDGQRRRLPALPRRGQDRREPVRDLQAARAAPSGAGACGSRSPPASTRATRSGSPTRARSGPAAARRAASTSPSTSPTTRR